MKYNLLSRILSAVLACSMIIHLLPAHVFAAENSNIPSETTSHQDSVQIVGEEESLRTETGKHFRLSDGSFISVSYGIPVHYQDDSGQWRDIIGEPVMASGATDTQTYRMSNADQAAVFSTSLEDGRIFTSSYEDVSVSISLLDTSQALELVGDSQISTEANVNLQTPAVEESLLTFSRNSSAELVSVDTDLLNVQGEEGWNAEDLIPDQFMSSLLYEDVFPDVDLLYTTYGYNIKEEIIVKSPQSSYRYDFQLNLDGLTAVLNDDGSVSLLDGEETEIYNIPAPFMTDNDGNFSADVSYALTYTEQGTILTVVANEEWINDEDRAFPVTIDPSLKLRTWFTGASRDASIYACFVQSGAPDGNSSLAQYLYCGYGRDVDDLDMQIYVYLNHLPTLPVGSVITDASLTFRQYTYHSQGADTMPIGLYGLSDYVTESNTDYFNLFVGMTWETRPARDNTVIDYVTLSKDVPKTYATWDMTELVKEWYKEGTENRIVVLAQTQDTYDTTYGAWQVFWGYGESYPPMFLVSYRNNTGIEPYYTYNTLGAASAGTAYIADASGQLKVARELLSYGSTANPFSLNLVYNSDYFSSDNSSDYQPSSELGLSMTVGSGWKLDCIQKIESETISSVEYLKYTDGDGTLHYFLKDTELDSTNVFYFDEDGLGLKIKKISSNDFEMSDDYGNSWTFTDYYLTSTKDSDGNEILINYDSKRVDTIVQKNNSGSEIIVANFGYSGNSLTHVTDAAGNVYTLTYDGTNLSTIQKGATTIAQYGYDGYRLNKMTDAESGYSLSFAYAQGKIAHFQEEANDTAGVQGSVTYPDYSQTTYRDHGVDRVANTDDDILTHYLFDYADRTVNAYSTDAAGNLLGASNAVYSGSGSTDKQNNRTMRTSSIGAAGQQLLRNTGLEASTDTWTFSGATRSTIKPRTGIYSVKGTASGQYATKISEALTAGTTYTFSAYINTGDITPSSGKGIYLKVTDDSGNSWSGDGVNYKTSSQVDGGWIRISVTFKAESGGAHSVGIYNDGASGTFYADDFQLEQGEAPSSYNLIENGSMVMGSHGWTMGAGATAGNAAINGPSAMSLNITGNPESAQTNAYQDISINLPGTETYVLSGWVQANAVLDNIQTATDEAQDLEKQCGLRAVLTYEADEDDNTAEQEYHYIPFNPDVDEWQFTSYALVPKQNSRTVESIRVYCAYERNANVAKFTNISLLREAAQTMAYDAEGNLKSVTTTNLSGEMNSYENGNLIKSVTGGQGTYRYDYDTCHRITAAKLGEDEDNPILTQTMTYDGYGNMLTSNLSGTGDETITTSATYSTDGNRLLSVTDATGATVSYAYSTGNSTMLGLPTSVTAPNGTVTNTVYDSFGRVTQTSVDDLAILNYNYSNGNLSSIVRTHGQDETQTYSFAYNGFGQTTEVKVGTRVLASYQYAESNGLLTKQTYGNGDIVTFTYDDLGRTKTVTYSDGTVVTYTYNGEGSLHCATVTKENTTTTRYLYNYDSLGRLISSEQKSGETTVLRTHQDFNEHNQLIIQSWQIGETAYSQQYEYNTDDGSLAKVTTSDGKTITMGYDGLRRLSQKVLKNGDTTFLTHNISYNPGTMQIASYGITTSAFNTTYSYTYDVSGNILSVGDGTNTTTYVYDSQNQLIRENNPAAGKTWTWEYDGVGNIQKRKVYTYTTAEDISGVTPNQTIEYGYADEMGWGDLLTAYDGHAIEYDAIGNPEDDGTWTYNWENGRQLASMNNGSITWTYEYDANGLRTRRSNGTLAYNYVYNGSSLTQMSVGTNLLNFTYDASGVPLSVTYNGVEYYYVTNLQGDVTAILNASGAAVVQYTYDAWGNILTTTGSMNSTLGVHNPLRYRGYVYDPETGLYYLQSRYYDPEIGRFINADAFASTGQGLLGNNMFAYCNNNPVKASDPTGQAFFLVTGAIGAIAGAVIGGLTAAANGENVLAGIGVGATVGGLAGLGLGAAAGVMLAGSALASTAAVATGASALGTTVMGSGIAAGMMMIADNISQAVNHSPQVFWSGGEVAKNASVQVANSINGLTLEMTRLGQYLEQTNASHKIWAAASSNFANVANNAASCIYSVQNAAGVRIQSIWATIEYPLVKLKEIIYIVAE